MISIETSFKEKGYTIVLKTKNVEEFFCASQVFEPQYDSSKILFRDTYKLDSYKNKCLLESLDLVFQSLSMESRGCILLKEINIFSVPS
mgnify:CR=1 FL=1